MRPVAVLAATACCAALLSVVDVAASATPITTPAYTSTANVADAMNRTVSTGFGVAPLGGSYATSGAGRFSVSPGAGNISSVASGTSARATLSGSTTADQRVRSAFVLPRLPTHGIGVSYQLELRRTAAADAYHFLLQVSPGGVMTISCAIWRNGSQTTVGLPFAMPGLAVAGRTFALEGMTAGSSTVLLRARAWLSGTAIPGWQVGASDSSATRLTGGGKVGVYVYTSSNTESMPVKVASLAGWSLTLAGSPPPVLPASAGRGSLPVGSAQYSVPANAIFVATTGVNTSTGTQQAPLRTLAAALTKATTGTTIVLRRGVYNESLSIPGTKSGVTIQAYPGEAVWLDGSIVVSNWAASGTTWVATGWKAQFDHWASFTTGSNAGGFVSPAYPMAAWPDQVFVDGTQLRQVGSAGGVVSGTFFVDYTAQTLRIGTNPSGHELRASNLSSAFTVSATNVTLRGFGVRRYANSLPKGGAIYLARSGDAVENVVVSDMATQGISMYKSNANLNHVSVIRAGMTGISGYLADGSTVRNSVITQSNSEHFNKAPSSAGMKIAQSHNIIIRNNDVSGGYTTHGIWLDISCIGFTIVGNTVKNNGAAPAIQVELSATGTVANNVIVGGTTGVYIFDSSAVKVFNNTFSLNSSGSVYVSQDGRRAAASGYPDPICTWVVKNITVSNNMFLNNGGPYGFQFWALDGTTNIPASDMAITITGNLFHTRSATTDSMVGWGGNAAKVTKYETPPALNTALSVSWTNRQVAPADVLASRTSANATAVPLPSDVAAAVGQPTGTKWVGAFLN